VRTHHQAVALLALTLGLQAAPQGLVAAEPASPDGPANLLAGSNTDFEQPGDGVAGWEIAYGGARVVPEDSGGRALECSNSAKLYSERIIEVRPGIVYHMSVRGRFRNL
jgi:hypothetical protein